MVKELTWAVGLFAAGFASYVLGALILSALSWAATVFVLLGIAARIEK